MAGGHVTGRRVFQPHLPQAEKQQLSLLQQKDYYITIVDPHPLMVEQQARTLLFYLEAFYREEVHFW